MREDGNLEGNGKFPFLRSPKWQNSNGFFNGESETEKKCQRSEKVVNPGTFPPSTMVFSYTSNSHFYPLIKFFTQIVNKTRKKFIGLWRGTMLDY